ncbi:MAG: hypothetical protein ABSF92_09705 [Candidatus Acidiferrales bacterium]
MQKAREELAQSRIEADRVATDLARAKADLRRSELLLAGVTGQLSVDSILRLFESCRCLGAEICARTFCLATATTFEQAQSALKAITDRLDKRAGDDVPVPSAWLQAVLETVIEKPSFPVTEAAGRQEPLCTEGLECYKALCPHLKDTDQLRTAAEQVRHWLGTQRLRKETVRVLLPPLLNAHPGDPRFLDIYDEVIRSGETATTTDEQDVASASLFGLLFLPNLGGPDLLRLLQTGFAVALRQWRAFSTAWTHAMHRALEADRVTDPTQLREILGRIDGHINAHGFKMIENETRHEEYMALASVIVRIHNSLGVPRKLRPRNRHVVRGEPSVRAVMTLKETSAAPVVGVLGNFSLGDRSWQAGAWITSEKDPTWPSSVASWRPATVTLEYGTGRTITLPSAEVNGPHEERTDCNVYGHAWGYRVRLPNLSQAEYNGLKELSTRYPITR